MYVRWKRTPLKRRLRWDETPDYSLSAVLVESRRVDGHPRQRYVKHLGAVRERCTGIPGHALGFWQTADAALTALGLVATEHQAIERQLSARVPRPSAGAMQAEIADLEARMTRAR